VEAALGDAALHQGPFLAENLANLVLGDGGVVPFGDAAIRVLIAAADDVVVELLAREGPAARLERFGDGPLVERLALDEHAVEVEDDGIEEHERGYRGTPTLRVGVLRVSQI
jgi:hypothetical protein